MRLPGFILKFVAKTILRLRAKELKSRNMSEIEVAELLLKDGLAENFRRHKTITLELIQWNVAFVGDALRLSNTQEIKLIYRLYHFYKALGMLKDDIPTNSVVE